MDALHPQTNWASGRISVITATFNAAVTLPATIESVRAQSGVDVEHLIIDGGSNDGTVGILESSGGDVQWISERDQGIYDAWNKGVQAATGEWLVFLGADDTLEPNALASLLRIAQKTPQIDIVSSRLRFLYQDGGSTVIGKPWSWPKFQEYMTIAHPGCLHHRSLFHRYGAFDLSFRICGDYEFLLRPGPALRAAYLPQITVNMRAGGASDSFASLHEAFRAKITTGGRTKILAIVDTSIAYAKLAVRRLLVTSRSAVQR